MLTISVEGITIEVQRKKMKNMTMRVCPPHGNVKISAPLRSSDISIHRFAISRIAWIQKHQSAYQSSHLAQSNAYHTGERHFLHGREYILRVHERVGKSQVIIADDTYLDLYIRKNASEASRQKALMDFYRLVLQDQLKPRIEYWEQKIGVSAHEYQIRHMKSRWGSCHPVKRKICLNLELIKYPLQCLEYVIVHELVHLLEASHNARFKALMDKFLPDWRVSKALFSFPTSHAE